MDDNMVTEIDLIREKEKIKPSRSKMIESILFDYITNENPKDEKL